jgi:hypothetical protein
LQEIRAMAADAERDKWLSQDDAALLGDCRVDTFRSSGPGGQHANKTSSAVRLRHMPSGLVAIAQEERSQHANKARAVKRLRMAIALQVRLTLPEMSEPGHTIGQYVTQTGRLSISRRNADYPAVIAVVLDAVDARHGRLREAAACLGLTTGQLSRFVTADAKVLQVANRIRQAAGLRPMTLPR